MLELAGSLYQCQKHVLLSRRSDLKRTKKRPSTGHNFLLSCLWAWKQSHGWLTSVKKSILLTEYTLGNFALVTDALWFRGQNINKYIHTNCILIFIQFSHKCYFIIYFIIFIIYFTALLFILFITDTTSWSNGIMRWSFHPCCIFIYLLFVQVSSSVWTL